MSRVPDRKAIDLLALMPEVYRDGDGGPLARFLQPFEELLLDLHEEIIGGDSTVPGEGGLAELFDLTSAPPRALSRNHADPEAFTFTALAFLGSWVGLPLRPPPARSPEWNRTFLTRAIPLLPLRGTLPGIDGMLRAWLAGDIVDPEPVAPTASRMLLVSDLQSDVNGADSVFRLDESATLGVDTVLGEGPEAYLVVDLVVDPEAPLLRHPVGVDALRRAALAMIDLERPLPVHGELRVRGHPMQLAPPGDPSTWQGDAVYAQLADPDIAEPHGTALLWDDAWVVLFPDETSKGPAW